MTDNSNLPVKRKRGNPNLVKGVSGNPNGRPKGSKSKVTLIKQAIESDLTEQLSYDASAILQKTIQLAKEGDTTCIKILMDRLLPALRSGDVNEKAGIGNIHIHVSSIPTEGQGITIEANTDDYDSE